MPFDFFDKKSPLNELTSRMRSANNFLGEMNLKNFSMPKNSQIWYERFVNNLNYFMANYLFVCLILIVVRIIMNPIFVLYIAGAFAMVTLGVNHHGEDLGLLTNVQQLKGIKLNQREAAVIFIGFTLIFSMLLGVLSDLSFVFWAGMVLVSLHASFRNNSLKSKFNSFVEGITRDLKDLETIDALEPLTEVLSQGDKNTLSDLKQRFKMK